MIILLYTYSQIFPIQYCGTEHLDSENLIAFKTLREITYDYYISSPRKWASGISDTCNRESLNF